MNLSEYIPDWYCGGKEMSGPTNRQDIVDDLKNLPSNFFNLLLLYALSINTEGLDNPKAMDDLKNKIKDYLGFNWVVDHYEPKSGLNKEARIETQNLIDIFNTIISH